MNRLKKSRESAMIVFNTISILALIGLCVYFYGEITDDAAITYLYRLAFPETSITTTNEQMVFHIVRILGTIVGGLSLCRIQITERPSIRKAIFAAIPFIVIMAISVTLLWNRMIINLVAAILLCLESLFYLWLCNGQEEK